MVRFLLMAQLKGKFNSLLISPSDEGQVKIGCLCKPCLSGIVMYFRAGTDDQFSVPIRSFDGYLIQK